MKCKTVLFFLSFFLFFSCSPKTKKKTSFSSATSLTDESIDFLPPASDVEYISGGVNVQTIIPGEASHVEIEFNGVLIKSCSSETLIPEEVATCPPEEDSCEIKVKACDDGSGECSDPTSVTVFLDTESASPSNAEAIMKAYETEQENLALARELKLEACVTERDLEKYPEEEISEEALALKAGVKGICEATDCDIMLSFSQFQSDFEDMVAEIALLADLEEQDLNTNDTNTSDTNTSDTNTSDTNTSDTNTSDEGEEDSNDVIVVDVDSEGGLSDTEVALTAVSATLGVALLTGGGVGIYLWRKHVRLKEEARLKDLSLQKLNTNLVNLEKQNKDLEAKVAAGGDRAEMSRLQTLLKAQKAEVLKLKKQRTYLVGERKALQSDLEAYRAKGLEAQLEQQKQALAAVNDALKKSEGEKARALQNLGAKVEELKALTAKSLSLEKTVQVAELQKQNADKVIESLKSERSRLSILQRDLLVAGRDDQEEIARLKGLLKEKDQKITDLEALSQQKAKDLDDVELLREDFDKKLAAKSAELTALQESMANQNLEFEELIPQIAVLGEEKEDLERELREAKQELFDELRQERAENEANKKKIEALEKDLAAGKLDKQADLERVRELAALRAQVGAKDAEIKKLAGVIAEGESKGKISRFYLMLQRRIHQSQIETLYKNWKDQVDALVQQLDKTVSQHLQDKGVSDKALEALTQKLNQQQENFKAIELAEAKDQKLKEATELVEKLKADIDSISKAGGEGSDAKVEVLRRRIKKLEAREYYRENVELRNKLRVYADKAQQALFTVLSTKKFQGRAELKKSLGRTILYAQDKGLLSKVNPTVKQFLDFGARKGYFEDVKVNKLGLVSSSKTEAFVEKVSDFLSTVTETHARAYQNSQESGDLLLENF